MALEADQAPPRTNAPAADTRPRWREHIKAALTDLRNSDRSTDEQRVYEALRTIAARFIE